MDTPASPNPAETTAWSPARRLAFRFAALYFALYAFPFPVDVLPGGELLGQAWHAIWDTVVPWVGNNVLGIDYEIIVGPNGSGDTTADYVTLVIKLAMALVGAGVWSALSRRRQAHPRMAAWLTVWARYWLGAFMIVYGFAKVFVLQFPFPDASRLLDTYGDSSPMGLLWTFMGYSPAYNVFTGGVEVLAGMLLLWRRTTTMGALVSIGAMTNVVMLNFCYDVPVKLFSSHLLIVASVLAAQDAPRLLGMLMGRAVPAREVPPVLTGRWGRRVRVILKVAFLGLVLVSQVVSSLQARAEYGPDAPKPPLYGMYDVVEHERDAGEQPVVRCDEHRWHRVGIGRWGLMRVHPMFGEPVFYMTAVDEEAGTIELTSRPDEDGEPVTQTLRFERPEEGVVVLEGFIDGVEHRATLRLRPDEDALLVNRGFNWINEHPFNR